MSDSLEAFRADHLIELIKEPDNQRFEHMVESGLIYELEKSRCMTYLRDGRPMACGGITNYWEGRGQVWTIFSSKAKYNFLPIFRAINGWLKYQLDNNYRRIEVSIPYDFYMGKRRALLMGFSLEVERARFYLPDGEDCSIYVMLRER